MIFVSGPDLNGKIILVQLSQIKGGAETVRVLDHKIAGPVLIKDISIGALAAGDLFNMLDARLVRLPLKFATADQGHAAVIRVVIRPDFKGQVIGHCGEVEGIVACTGSACLNNGVNIPIVFELVDVIALAAVQFVIALAADQGVVVHSAVQFVIPCKTGQGVIAATAGKDVGGDNVVAGYGVVARASDNFLNFGDAFSNARCHHFTGQRLEGLLNSTHIPGQINR